jgi:hypothetical protein
MSLDKSDETAKAERSVTRGSRYNAGAAVRNATVVSFLLGFLPR